MHPRWGAVCHGQRTNGRWSDDERSQHINLLELKAAFPGPKVLSEEPISQGGVPENGHGTTAIAHINNKGGTWSNSLRAPTM